MSEQEPIIESKDTKPKTVEKTPLVKKHIANILDTENPPLNNPDEINILRKRVQSDLNLTGGWNGKTKKLIMAELESRGLAGQIDNKNLNVNITAPEKKLHSQPTGSHTNAQSQQQQGAEQDSATEGQPSAPLSPEAASAVETIMVSAFKTINRFYSKMGMIPNAPPEPEPSAKTKRQAFEDFEIESTERAKELAAILAEYGIELPKVVKLVMALGGVAMLYGAPVIERFLGGSQAKETADKVIKLKKGTNNAEVTQALKGVKM